MQTAYNTEDVATKLERTGRVYNPSSASLPNAVIGFPEAKTKAVHSIHMQQDSPDHSEVIRVA